MGDGLKRAKELRDRYLACNPQRPELSVRRIGENRVVVPAGSGLDLVAFAVWSTARRYGWNC
jgi:hypothetical protein